MGWNSRARKKAQDSTCSIQAVSNTMNGPFDCSNSWDDSFTPSKIPEDQVMDEFLKAVVEVFQFTEHKVSLDKLDNVSPDFEWPSGIEIKYENGKDGPTIAFLNETAEKSFLELLGLAETQTIQPEESMDSTAEDIPVVVTSDLSWKDIPLEDMNLRFAVSFI